MRRACLREDPEAVPDADRGDRRSPAGREPEADLAQEVSLRSAPRQAQQESHPVSPEALPCPVLLVVVRKVLLRRVLLVVLLPEQEAASHPAESEARREQRLPADERRQDGVV